MMLPFAHSAFFSFVVNHLWQSSLITLLAALLAFSLRGNQARIRYWVWMSASIKFLIPFALFITAGEAIRSAFHTPIQKPALSAVMQRLNQPFSLPTALTSTYVASPAPPTNVSIMEQLLGHIPLVLLVIWLAGVLILSLSWMQKWRSLRRLVRAARPAQLTAEIPILYSTSLNEPGVFGLFRPIVLLPKGIADRLTVEQLATIIAHEIAHIRRRDNLTAAIHMAVCTLFWFHPFVWWIKSRLLEEREQACDEAVLLSCNEPNLYAESIISVCKFYVESPLACVSGITGSELKQRIIRILTNSLANKLDWRKKLLMGLATTAALALPLAFGIVNLTASDAQTALSTRFSAAQRSDPPASTPVPDWHLATYPKPVFSKISIKPSTPGTFTPPSFPLTEGDNYEGNDYKKVNGEDPNPHGHLFADMQIVWVIEFAYKVHLTESQRKAMLANVPEWVGTKAFTIDASIPGDVPEDSMRLLTQSMLADRFKLSLHWESQETDAYNLVVETPGKTGPWLIPHENGPSCDVWIPKGYDGNKSPENTYDPYIAYGCGNVNRMYRTKGKMIAASRNITLERAARYFPDFGGYEFPIIDQTGLTGRYDFNVEWGTPDQDPKITDSAKREGSQRLEWQKNFSQALKNQLGLKLVPAKARVITPVIDHIEMPTLN